MSKKNTKSKVKEEKTEEKNAKYSSDPDFLEYDESVEVKKTLDAEEDSKESSSKKVEEKKEPSKKTSVAEKVVDSIKKCKLSLWVAYAFNIIYGFFFYRSFNNISLFDTGSYERAADVFLEGGIDLLRTPVYPLFLHLCKKLAPEDKYIDFTATVQIILFFISMFFFYKLLEYFTKNDVILSLGTIFYGCFSPIIIFNTYLLTESLSVTLIVIYAYILVRYVRTKSLKCLTGVAVLSYILTMQRPSALNLYIVTFIIMIPYLWDITNRYFKFTKKAEDSEEKKISKKQLIPAGTFLLAVLLLFGYMDKNSIQNGYFGLSYVSEMNKFYDVVQAEIWQNNPDTEIVQFIQEKQDEGAGILGSAIQVESLLREEMHCDPSRLVEFNEEAIRINHSDYVTYLVDKSIHMGETNMLYNLSMDSYQLKEEVSNTKVWIGDFLDCNVNFVYLTFLISMVIIVAVLITKKTLLWDYLAITLIIGGQLAVNIMAGPAEFHRLNIPCYPFSLMLLMIWAGIATEGIIANLKQEKEDLKIKA